jgi:hypothetical protein
MKPTPEPRNHEERFAQMRANLKNVFTRPQHRRQIEEDLFRARQDTLAVNGEYRVPYDQSWKDATAKYVTGDIKFWRAQMKAFRSGDARDLEKYFGDINALREAPPEMEDMHAEYDYDD